MPVYVTRPQTNHAVSSCVQGLNRHLRLGPEKLAISILVDFSFYAIGYLAKQSDWDAVQEPNFHQVMARIRLTLRHRGERWLWTHNPPLFRDDEDTSLWTQDDHAANFVLRVLHDVIDYQNKGESTPYWCCYDEDVTLEDVVHAILERLCVLQSIWIGTDAWIEDRRLRHELAQKLAYVTEVFAGRTVYEHMLQRIA
jgi:hypothetical protein